MRRKSAYVPAPKLTRLTVKDETQLMDFLLAKMGGMSRSSVKSLLAHRQISVNDKITTQFDFVLKPNDQVTVNTTRGNLELTHPKLRIIFEDTDLIVVEKKRGIAYSDYRHQSRYHSIFYSEKPRKEILTGK